ncbi:hypothetical protein C8Q78DRAFT_979827, partial [Trametes maxima]
RSVTTPQFPHAVSGEGLLCAASSLPGANPASSSVLSLRSNMVHRLPYDVQLAILGLLGARDVVRLCLTCRALYSLMADRTLWHHALSRLLSVFPQPQLSRRMNQLTANELKAHVVHSVRLDRDWHRVDYAPRLVRNFTCDSAVEHVSLVAGGEWLVVVLYDGSLQLRALSTPTATPVATLSHALTEGESVFYLSSRQSFTDEHEDLVILQMGVRYDQCTIYVYHIAVVAPDPAFALVGKVSVTGSVWCCASGGRSLVYGLESDSGDMVLYVCPVGTDSADSPPRAQVAMNIGPWSADEDFSISVLSERQLLLAYHGGLAVYDVPAPHPDAPQSPQTTVAMPVPVPVPVQPIWSRRCDIGSGIYRISQYSWDTRHRRRYPVVVAGTHALHVLRVSPSLDPVTDSVVPTVDYRTIPYPFNANTSIPAGWVRTRTDAGHMGLGAVGLRRAIWDSTEARNGALHVHFRTYSLPRAILDLGADDPDFGGGGDAELGGRAGRGRMGGFTVTLDPEEHLVSVCMDEASGRVCLLLNNIVTGARRISVIDAV